MRKHFLFTCMAVVALLMGACNEEDNLRVHDENGVTFNVTIPELGTSTRAVGDGLTATTLYWGVYDHNNVLLQDISNTTNNGHKVHGGQTFSKSTKLTLTLAQDKKYSIIFWAANADNSMCTVDWEARKMTVNPAEANQESYDAFCKYEVIDNVSGYMTRDVKLKRPFAQLNIGTADIAKAAASGLTVKNTMVVIEGLPTTYFFENNPQSEAGKVDTEGKETFTYDYSDPAPVYFKEGNVAVSVDGDDDTDVFPVTGYEYLSMNYALIGADKELVDVTFKYMDDDAQEHTRTYSSVPVQRNWRTNIYGNILTSEADFTVTIVPEFADEYNPNDIHNIKVWDGKTFDTPEIDEANKTVTIKNANQLAWLAASVNGTLPVSTRAGETQPANSYDNWTILLANNIDLGGEEWTPIGLKGKRFMGTFDGQEHTISNLKISTANNGAQAALFGDINIATIKNLTIDNAQILYPADYSDDFYGAAVVSQAYCETLQNITVKNSTIQGNNKVAAILAHDADGASMIIENCHVEGCTIEVKNEKDGGNAAGIVGSVQGSKNTKSLKNCSVKNTTFNVVNSADAGKRSNAQMVATLITTPETVLTLEGCVVEGNTFNQTGVVNYVSPYDEVFVGGAREKATGAVEIGTVIINGVKYTGILPEEIVLDENQPIVYSSLAADYGVTISGTGTVIFNNVAIKAAEGAAVTLAEGAKVTLELKNGVNLTGATSAISVPADATLTLKGEQQNGSYIFEGLAGSGIGGAGSINIETLVGITAKGNGKHAFGIGGNGATVTIKNSTVDYVCGGHIQPLFESDPNWGKSEPEGGAAIGGATIKIEGSVITKADGGSKAAAIGAQYWQSTDIEILNSTILEANGGNASAGIGGSRYVKSKSADNKQSTVIRIEGSTVNATGGQFGAGIGSGYDTYCAASDINAINDITIINSTVTAQGGKYAAGIGTGHHAAALTGSIDAASTIKATSGEAFYKDDYTTAQNIGYGVVDPAREFSGASVTFTVADKLIEHPVGYYYDEVKKEYNVVSAQGLEKALTIAGAAGAGNSTINITSDLNLTGVEWTPINVNGYNGADIVTIEGNSKTITGLTAPLFAGGFAGGSGIVIKNLTIDASTIVSTNGEGAGAFVEASDSQDKIYLENCHLKNSSVTGSRTGGLVGWTSGYNKENDGPVKTYVTFLNCSVDNCTITGTSVGGLNGHAGANAWTYTTIENCSVTNCKLNSTDTGDWRVGVAVGTANVGEVTITNLTESGNTLTQTGKTAPTGEKRNYYGRFVPGSTGKLVIDGVSYVANAAALGNAAEGSTFVLSEGVDLGTVEVGELKNVTIKGAEGSVMIFKTDANTKIENVTLQNVNFKYTTGATADCGIVIDPNAQIDNLVLEGCTFTGTGEKAGRGLSGVNNNASIVIKSCTFKDLGYPIYAWGGYEALTIEGCTFDNIKSWAIMPQSGFDGDLTVTGCTFKNCLGGGLVKAGTLTADHTFTFTNNTITGCTVTGDHNWFQFNVSAGTSVISGNKKDGADWTPTATDGLK